MINQHKNDWKASESTLVVRSHSVYLSYVGYPTREWDVHASYEASARGVALV